MSREVLDALARALRLDAVEHAHLHDLAAPAQARRVAEAVPQRIVGWSVSARSAVPADPEVSRWWGDREVRGASSVTEHVRQPGAGDLAFGVELVAAPWDPEAQLVVRTVQPGSATARVLPLLASGEVVWRSAPTDLPAAGGARLVGVSAPGGGWFGRRNVDDAALATARAEKGTAAMTLLELDTVQRRVETQVQAYLDYAPVEAQRFSQSWAPVQSEANGAITHYLEVAGEHDVDLELESGAARAAANAFNAAGARMHAADLAVAAFAERSEASFEKVRIAGSQFDRTMREVDGLLTHAEQAVATASSAGLRTAEPEQLLARARAELRTAREGVSVHGLRAANDAARDAAEHARSAATAADGLEERAAEIAQRLSSTRTRLQVSRERTRGTDAGLSELRKRFSAGASDDLADVGEQVSAHLADAEDAVRRAAALSEQQRWADAESALAQGRSAVVTAEGLADRVRTRLAELDAVIADPHGPLTAARRAVRDAQRFLLELAPELEQGSDALPSSNPYARAARTLDSLAERAVDAEDGLAARDSPGTGRVDHWEWLHALAGVSDSAASVVAELRERQAR